MPGLRLFVSNRLEILAETLAEVLRTPLASPLDQEIIVVQSKGMERWLSMALASYHGIWANYRCPFPNAFIYELFRTVMHDLPERSPFEPGTLTWEIMKLLPTLVELPAFESLRSYIGANADELKRLQLSERIADTFDQYLLFRPQMIFEWEEGEKDHWQAVLWRELVKGQQKKHRAALGRSFLEILEDSFTETEKLPQRVSVFGISALPRFHMQILAGISPYTEVNLFLMNPCKEYWGDILSDRGIKGTLAREGKKGLGVEELHLEKGNSLLASMGVIGRDFFDLVNEFQSEESFVFEESGDVTLLACIQSDILNLEDRGQQPQWDKVLKHNDRSIQIHSCHSPMREMEVLHDRLLDMFEKDPSLLPKDILVMTPDIEAYAPYIQAVFETPRNDDKRIPFTIADQNIRKESHIIDRFLALLDLCGGRFTASEILPILESPAVRRKFELIEADLELIFKWVNETRIRWGIDERSRAELGLPPFQANTWKAGLERLLLGYAMPAHDDNLFEGVVPYGPIEGGEALVLGRFLEFTEQLFTQMTSLGSPRTLEQWSEKLTDLLDRFFMPDEDAEGEMQAIRRLLRNMSEVAEDSDFREPLHFDGIKWYLENHLEREGFGFGFISGGVTFCAMLPMRSIPAKVICLVGLNGNAYPRESRASGFDLMARHPRPGDRSRRNDDRYLFLEAILSARETLYISYVGQSIQDNSPMPPSVLVSELMDYIEQGFQVPEGEILDQIVTKHRLQPFSGEYFKNSKMHFSYSEESCRISQRMLEPGQDRQPLISKGLSEPEAEWRTVDLDDLCRFWSNPTRFLLTRRMGIHLEERASLLEETEPLEVGALERYLLEVRLVERRLAGGDLKQFFPVVRACGQLPHGAVGECLYDDVSLGVESFYAQTEIHMQGERLAPLEVDLDIAGFKLTGRIAGVYPERLLQHRYARVKPTDHLRVWICHLAMNAVAAVQYPRSSLLAALHHPAKQPFLWEYLPVANSAEILGGLLDHYWRGLVKPVHFFPGSSWEYASILLERKKTEEEALRGGRNAWRGNDFVPGESSNSYYQLCFRGTEPLDGEFQSLAKEILGPLFRHLKELGT